MLLKKQLAQYIKNGDLSGYVHARYPAVQEGEGVTFQGEDFSSVDFSPFVLGFMVFKNCVLDSAVLQGQPITLIDCSAQNLTFNKSTVIIAHNTDFRGLNYSPTTVLAKKENGDAGCSHFIIAFLMKPQKHILNGKVLSLQII